MPSAQTVTHLSKIVDATRAAVARRKALANRDALENQAARHTPRGFAAAVSRAATHGPAIIAELKKASPSRGLIRADFDPAALALQMSRAGAVALSVLTEEQFFQGSLENLRIASAAAPIPCLRKDFIVDAFQILEARANGADAVLLIAAALDDASLTDLRAAARQLQLDVLCEIHNAEEASRVRDLDCELIGVNNRNLKTLAVDLKVAEDLAASLPTNCVRVAESGISTANDLRRLRDCGYQGFLIGESLMKQADPSAALRSLLAGN